MKITATTQPQAIYPDGWQHPLVITNEGPSTVWLGSDSSTSVTQSMPLAPLAAVVWSAGKPLWVVSDGRANVRIDYNEDSPSGGGASQNVIQPIENADGELYYEVGSYASVEVRFLSGLDAPESSGGEWDPTGFLSFVSPLSFYWRKSSDGIVTDIPPLIAYETLYITPTYDDPLSSTYERNSIVRDVQGPYLMINHTHQSGQSDRIGEVVVIGSTIPLRERMGFSLREGLVGNGTIGSPGSVFPGKRFCRFGFSQGLNADGYRVGIPNEGEKFSFSMRFSAATTSAVTIDFVVLGSTAMGMANTVFRTAAIAAGTTDFRLADIYMPPGAQCYFIVNGSWGLQSGSGVIIWTDE